MPVRCLALVVCLLAGSAALAQVQIDDRPKPLTGDRPLTREELNRRKADRLLRDALAQYGVGVIRHRQERLIDALNTLEKARALDPESLEIRRALVPLLATLGRDEEALAAARQVIDREPFDLETAFQLARLLRSGGQSTEAIPVLQQAVGGKEAGDRPERLLIILAELIDLCEKQGDFAGAARAHDQLIGTITGKREQLLYGNGLTREELQATLARAYEGLGRACVTVKEYDRAAAAFRGARETLLKCEDARARHQAVRISLNMSEVAAAQGRWAEAIEALDTYLEHGPADVGPYETRIDLLRKLGRDRDIVPSLRKYAAREEHNLGLQLLLARELAADPRTRPEAERMYRALLTKDVKPEIYRGLFRLYQAADRMGAVLDLFDESLRVAQPEPEAKVSASDRETAAARVRAMQAVFRIDRELVAALLPEALAELGRDKQRRQSTWLLLAHLAVRTRQPALAEKFFRPCLRNTPPAHEAFVYAGFIQVLMAQHKYDEVVRVCEGALNGPNRLRNTNAKFLESRLAAALSAMEEYDKALTHANLAIAGTNDDDKVDFRCEKAMILANAGRYDEAVRECQETLKEFTRLKQVLTVRYTLSNVYSLQGEHATSEEQLRLILDTDPDQALANNNLGYQMADRNVNLDEGERLIRRALELDRRARKELEEEGENAAYLDSLGWVLFRRGKLAEAREWLEKAAALPDGADDPAVWDHLGDVLAKLDQPARAKEAWQTALKLYDRGGRRKSDARRAEVERKLKTVE